MRLLYVEDDPLDAELILHVLAFHAPDMAVDHVVTLAAAKNRLSGPDTYDLLLVDLNLPDGNGLDLVAFVRTRGLPMAVVVLTGWNDEQAAVSALQVGADDFLAKSSDNDSQVVATLRGALARNREATANKSRPIHVLYAEKNATDVELTRRQLTERFPHIRLTAVAHPLDVLEILPAEPGKASIYDVLLLDFATPALETLETIKILRTGWQLPIPIVLTAASGSEVLVSQALRLGADDYLCKYPGYLNELPAILEKVCREAELSKERERLKEMTQRLNRLLASSPVLIFTLRLQNGDAVTSWVSENITRLLGFSVEETLRRNWWHNHLYPDDRKLATAGMSTLLQSGRLTVDYRFIDRAGRVHWIHDESVLMHGADQSGCEAISVWRDITEAKQAEQFQQIRIATLDKLVGNHPLSAILGEIAAGLERIRPEMKVSILLRDSRTGRLYTEAAPSLPQSYIAAIDGIMTGEGVGSCGTAAATGKPVIVEDIQSHPYWTAYRHLTEPIGLRACWSVPFMDEDGGVLGTFAIYYGEVRSPSRADLELIDEFARLTNLAVRRIRSDTAQRQAAAVFANTREGVLITDLSGRIVAVNRAFTDISGYSEAEVLDCNPRLLQSGRHDRVFYQTIWGSIQETGYWQGEIWNRRKNGELYPQLLTISTVYDSNGSATHYVGVMTDISQLKHSQNQLHRLAHYDPLTNLPNRLLVQSRLQHALERAERQESLVAVMFIDLDRFKNINDSLGHPSGDDLLQILSQRLQRQIREEDTLGRWGGDEFLMVLEGLTRPEDAGVVARMVLGLLANPIALPGGPEVYVGASIGISLFPNDGRCVTELIQHADVAMYQAKEYGRNTYRFYTPALTKAANERLEMEARLRRALANEEFVLHYQPQIDIASGAVIGCEALVRWLDPVLGLIAPDRFIPVAEETGLIGTLGEWVLLTACAQAQQWRENGLDHLVMSVNLSVRQLDRRGLVETVAAILATSGLPPGCLKLELTESMIMNQGEHAVDLLRRLKELGVHLSIDDFGTGYSSLSYLKRFPIDELKIDRGFVRDIPADSNDMEIAATIIAMARNLKLKVVAEGVETPEQLAFLARQGCHAYQGYLFSRPLPADQFSRTLIEGSSG